MSLPIASLVAEHRELGLIVALLLGVGFGFVLERAGFGRADKLVGQFLLRDMTVLKVMFSAIITAMLGVILASGLGIIELKALSEGATSETFIWSMLAGGLLLGVGFAISGYCPGTSAVASASGNLDGVFTFVGVIIGSLIFAEGFPVLGKLYHAGPQGHLFLYDWLGVPAPAVALGVTLFALVFFLAGEKVERIMARRRGESEEAAVVKAQRGRPKKLVFAGLAGVGVLALGTLALPVEPKASTVKAAPQMGQRQLAERLLAEPWTLRVLDLRADKQCNEKRIPGAECAPLKTLDKLGLAYSSGAKDLVLVGAAALKKAPAPALGYPGKIFRLEGGFAGWRAYALTKPAPPSASAGARAREAYTFRAALHAAMTGRKAPAPAPAGVKKYVPRKKKKKGGGCG